MNIPTIVVLILFIAFVALVACYMCHKGVGCSCSKCDRCGCGCKGKNLLLFLLLLPLCGVAQNENERLSFNLKDGSAAKIKISNMAGMMSVKKDYKTGADTEDYETLLVVNKEGKAAALPLKDILRINHINGEPTDGTYGATWYEIQREWGEHSEVVMLNSINNYNNGVGVITQQYDHNWCGQRTGFPVFFLATCDLGYEVDFTVRGLDSGFLYSDYSGYVFWLAQNDERNPCGQSCWCFYMGEEPVIIEAKATENTEYETYPWLGDYYGFPVELTESFLYQGVNSSATRLSLKGNSSYIFSSTAQSVPVTSNMLYSYKDGAFRYQLDESGDLTWRGDRDYFGMVGHWLTDDLIYLRAENLNVNSPSNNRYYFMLKDAKADFRMNVGAKDNWNGRATKYLAELYYDGAYHYFFLDNYGAEVLEAEVKFTSGTTIAGACDALVTYVDGQGTEHSFRYLTEDGTNPKFLDNTNPDPKPETAEWTGPKAFQNMSAHGVYDGKESTNHRIYVYMGKNPYGSTDKPGYCSIRVDFATGTGRYTDVISTSGTYVYNPSAQTLTVSGLLLGAQGGGALYEHTLVFKVSEDLKTLTLDSETNGETLYGSRTNTYIYTGAENSVVAE